jgi:hypothetical protein
MKTVLLLLSMDQYFVSACVLLFPHRVMIQQVLGCAGHSICWDYILMCRYGIAKFIGAVIQDTTSLFGRSGVPVLIDRWAILTKGFHGCPHTYIAP